MTKACEMTLRLAPAALGAWQTAVGHEWLIADDPPVRRPLAFRASCHRRHGSCYRLPSCGQFEFFERHLRLQITDQSRPFFNWQLRE